MTEISTDQFTESKLFTRSNADPQLEMRNPN